MDNNDLNTNETLIDGEAVNNDVQTETIPESTVETLEYSEEGVTPAKPVKEKSNSMISMIIGIVAFILLCIMTCVMTMGFPFFFGWIFVAIPVYGLVLGIKGIKTDDGKKVMGIIGIILNSISTLMGLIVFVMGIISKVAEIFS